MATYLATAPAVWQGRNDGEDNDQLRWHQIMHLVDINEGNFPALEKKQTGIALIGFCCDEGVKRNLGRVGAAEAPAAIRKACKNFPFVTPRIVYADAGDILCNDGDVEAAQALLAVKVATIHDAGYLPIVLGGGQEAVYGTFCGHTPLSKKDELGIINFDAHFDLRPYNEDQGANSGTWAYQINEHCKKAGIPFHYLVMGIQQYSNTLRFFEMANDMGAPYFLAEHFTNDQVEHMLNVLNGVISNASRLQLTIDMDVFAAAHAPGVSAPAYNGIAPNAMFKRFLRHIIFSGKVSAIDIAEVNPLYDVDDRTSRLAAACIFDIVQALELMEL